MIVYDVLNCYLYVLFKRNESYYIDEFRLRIKYYLISKYLNFCIYLLMDKI